MQEWIAVLISATAGVAGAIVGGWISLRATRESDRRTRRDQDLRRWDSQIGEACEQIMAFADTVITPLFHGNQKPWEHPDSKLTKLEFLSKHWGPVSKMTLFAPAELANSAALVVQYGYLVVTSKESEFERTEAEFNTLFAKFVEDARSQMRITLDSAPPGTPEISP